MLMNLMRSMTMAFFFLCLYDGLIAPNARASGEESWTRCHHHTEGSVPGGVYQIEARTLTVQIKQTVFSATWPPQFNQISAEQVYV